MNADNNKGSISTKNSTTMNEHAENNSLSSDFKLNYLENNKDAYKEYLLVFCDEHNEEIIDLEFECK